MRHAEPARCPLHPHGDQATGVARSPPMLGRCPCCLCMIRRSVLEPGGRQERMSCTRRSGCHRQPKARLTCRDCRPVGTSSPGLRELREARVAAGAAAARRCGSPRPGRLCSRQPGAASAVASRGLPFATWRLTVRVDCGNAHGRPLVAGKPCRCSSNLDRRITAELKPESGKESPAARHGVGENR